MLRLKSRTECPVNGFWFNQPETGWSKQTWDFNSMVAEVQAHRAQNPRFNLTTDLESVRSEVDNQNAMRMLSIRGADSYVVADGGPPPNRQAPRLRGLASAAGGVKNVASGAGVLIDWLGAGAVPVEAAKATFRASVCANCPKNQPGDWTSWFTQPAADAIRQQLSLRNDLNLKTPHDDKLVVCSACGCPLQLKVHVPLAHIAEHLSESVKPKLDPACWILSEMKI